MENIMFDLSFQLAKAQLEDYFSFYYSTNGGNETIGLIETYELGTDLDLINSDDLNFDEDIEDQYEKDKITYEKAIKMQIIRNLKEFACGICTVIKLIEKEQNNE